MRDVDVHMSGIGSSLFWSALAPPGSVTVNLGHMRQELTPGLPSFGEEFLGMSNRRSRTLYLPFEVVQRGPGAEDIVFWLERAASLVRSGFAIPAVAPEENLSLIGRTILELTRRSESSRLGLMGWFNHNGRLAYDVQARWLCGSQSSSNLVYEASTIKTCGMDLDVLRAVKRDLGLAKALNYKKNCSCVVCVACGH